jgi:hypothetical protein
MANQQPAAETRFEQQWFWDWYNSAARREYDTVEDAVNAWLQAEQGASTEHGDD